MRTNSFSFNIQKRETKKKGVVYDVYFYVADPDGRMVQKKLSGFKTQADARRAYSAFMERVLSAPQTLKKEKPKVLLYEDAYRAYTASVAPLIKESSMYEFQHTAGRYFAVFFHKKNLYALTKADVLAFQDWLYSQKKKDGTAYSPQSVLKVYRIFSTFYNWCVQRFDVPDVMQKLAMPTRRVQKREYVVWTQDDFNRFIAVVDNDKYRALFTVLFYGGMRIGEAQALKVSDYDGSALFIHSTYTKKTLDGSAFKITETKNYKSRRVPLPAPCRAVLDEFVKNRPGDEFMFGSSAPLSVNAIRTYFDSRIKRANVQRVRIHDLRHSYVSLLLSLGCSLPCVASLVGDTIEQVVKTYAHSIEDEKAAIINSIV